jgi:DNA-directed RNA polymerase specialized sigma24 family protein
MVSETQTRAEFDAAYPRFVAVAHRATRNFFRYDTSKVGDAVAETMARTFARWDTVRGQESPHGWVVVCAKDVCLEQLRADARSDRSRDEVEPIVSAATIWQSLHRLSRRQRSVAVLRHLMGFDKIATARALGTSIVNVESATREAGCAVGSQLGGLYVGRARAERLDEKRVYEYATVVGGARRQRRRRGYVVGLAVLTVVAALSTVPSLTPAPAARIERVVPRTEATADDTTFAALEAMHATNKSVSNAVLAVGDSVMLGAATTLEAGIPNVFVDAKISRGIADAAAVLQQYNRAGILPPTVVIGLATNGTFTDEQFAQMMQVLGRRRAIFLNALMPRPWEAEVNRRLAANVANYPNARLLDWNRIGSAHPGWFVADGTHLNPTGMRGYEALIRASVADD